jgi:hypothetical protein
MQRWKRTGRLVALGAMGLVQAACGTGTYDLTCSVDKDCLESELCHPDQKLCVQMCTTNAECPAETKSCKAISEENPQTICCKASSEENPQTICKCLTEECINETDP